VAASYRPASAGDSLLTIGEVALRLGVSRATAYKLCAAGQLPHLRICNALRVRLVDLLYFFARRPPT
jgi:excisionase family DNA binding protein